MPDLEPITREEMLLDGEDLEPITRKEMFIKRIYDKTQVVPEPITREEMFLKKAGDETTDVTIEQLNVSANGTYSESGKAYSPVIVNVPAPPIPDNAYLLNEVEGLPSDIATFSDGSNLPMPKLQVGIEPQQDLHGYDYPWVGGAGKNKLPVTCESTTKQGVVYTVTKNSSGAVIKIHAEGTALADHSYSVVEGYNASNPFRIKAGSYWFKGIDNGISGSFDFNLRKAGETSDLVQTTTKKAVVLSEDTDFQSCYLYVYSGAQINIDIYPMIWLQSETSDDFAPYSNICPISGHTEANIVVSPTTDAEDGTTYNVQFKDGDNPLTVYGGTLDVVSGELVVTHGYVDLGDLTWIYGEAQNRFTSTSLSNLIKKVYDPNILKCSALKPDIAPISTTEPTGDGTICVYTNGYIFVRDLAYTDASTFKTAMSGVQLVYELATPITYQLTPTQVKSLLGSNNVWCDTGKIEELEYFSKEV